MARVPATSPRTPAAPAGAVEAGAPPRKRARIWLECGVVAAAFVGLALLRLPQLRAAPSHAFVGATAADAITVMWTVWHVGVHVLEHGDLGTHTQHINFPDGAAIWPATPLESVLLAPLTAARGGVAAYNTLQIGHVGLAAAAAWLWIRRLGAGVGAAAVAAPALALCSMLLCAMHNGNVEAGQVYWLPVAALLGWRAVRASPDLHPARCPAPVDGTGVQVALSLGAATAVALAIIGNIYVGIATATIVAGVLLAGLQERPSERSRWLRAAAVVLGAAVLAVPVMAFAAGLGTDENAVISKSSDVVFHMRMLEGAASVAGFFAPGGRTGAVTQRSARGLLEWLGDRLGGALPRRLRWLAVAAGAARGAASGWRPWCVCF